jgi:hypothetical protein
MPAMSQQWPPQQPGQSQPSGPYGPPQDPGQYGPLSSYGQGGQYGQYGPPSQGGQYGQYGPPSQGYPPQQPGPQGEPSAPAYPTYPPAQPGAPGMPGPANQYPPQYPPQYPSGPYPPAGYPGGYGAPPSYGMPPAPKPSRGWVVPLIVVLILLILAGGGGAVFALSRGGTNTASGTPTATATIAATATPTTGPAPAGFTLYTDPAGYYSIIAPSAWKTDAQSGFVQFSSTSDVALVEVGFESVATGTATDDLNAFFTSFSSSGGGTVSHKQSPTSATLGGESGLQESADLTKSGLTFHAVVLVADRSGGRALVAYLSPTATFSSLNSQYFQQMIASFTFLK